ncbi:MAG TPA: hemerythrin domain-containing protein [Candidatus Binatia bacterium]|nr:hemerythrin domain-containing protein [Candidatus Binatia bacterium]
MDIYNALHRDHEELKQLLTDLVEATQFNDETTHLLHSVRNLLVPHSRAEEEVFYNSIRDLEPGNDQVMHGFKEHMEAEALLRSLMGMSAIGIEWTAAAEKLRDAVFHHIEEEETQIFPIAQRLFDHQESHDIGVAFVSLKPQVAEEGMIKNAVHLVSNLMPARLRREGDQPTLRRRTA